eukprot:g640.t1
MPKTEPLLPEWGTIYTARFEPHVSMGLELWRVTHRLGPALRPLLPSLPAASSAVTSDTNAAMPEDNDDLCDAVVVHNVIDSADRHASSGKILKGDILVGLNGDSVVGYFRGKAMAVRLESLLNTIAKFPTTRTLWFFRAAKNPRKGGEGMVRFPLECSDGTPLLLTKWHPPPTSRSLVGAKAGLKHMSSSPTNANANVNPTTAENEKPTSSSEDRRPSTAASENLTVLRAKIIRKGLFLPEGDGLLAVRDKKLRGIEYEVKISVKTETKVLEEESDNFKPHEDDEVEEEIGGDGHTKRRIIRKRRILDFHIREVYHGSPMYGSDLHAQVTEADFMEMLEKNSGYKTRVQRITSEMAEAGQKGPIYGTISDKLVNVLLKCMDVKNSPNDRRKMNLIIRVPKALRKSMSRKMSTKSLTRSSSSTDVKASPSDEAKEANISAEKSILPTQESLISLQNQSILLDSSSATLDNTERGLLELTGEGSIPTKSSSGMTRITEGLLDDVTTIGSGEDGLQGNITKESAGMKGVDRDEDAEKLSTEKRGYERDQERKGGDNLKQKAEEDQEEGGKKEEEGGKKEEGERRNSDDGTTNTGHGDEETQAFSSPTPKSSSPSSPVSEQQMEPEEDAAEMASKNADVNDERKEAAIETGLSEPKKELQQKKAGKTSEKKKAERPMSGELSSGKTRSGSRPSTSSSQRRILASREGIKKLAPIQQQSDQRLNGNGIPKKSGLAPIHGTATSPSSAEPRVETENTSSQPKLAPLQRGPATGTIAASQSVPGIRSGGDAMSAMSALQLDDASLRLQRVDTLRTQQNVTLMQIVEIEKRLEEQRLEMLSNAMPGDRKRLLRAFRHEREAAARNIRKVVAKQRADLRGAMIRYNVEFLGRSSQMVASTALSQQHHSPNSQLKGFVDVGAGRSMSARGMRADKNAGVTDEFAMPFGVTGAVPTVSSQSSAILDNASVEGNMLPPLSSKSKR